MLIYSVLLMFIICLSIPTSTYLLHIYVHLLAVRRINDIIYIDLQIHTQKEIKEHVFRTFPAVRLCNHETTDCIHMI